MIDELNGWADEILAKGEKPPPGFTPVPNSKVGLYHKRKGNGWEYWKPGASVSKAPKLTAAQAKGLKLLASRKTVSLTRYARPTDETFPIRPAVMQALVKAGFAKLVHTNEGGVDTGAGPFGSTSRGWRTNDYVEHIYKITDAGREALELHEAKP